MRAAAIGLTGRDLTARTVADLRTGDQVAVPTVRWEIRPDGHPAITDLPDAAIWQVCDREPDGTVWIVSTEAPDIQHTDDQTIAVWRVERTRA